MMARAMFPQPINPKVYMVSPYFARMGAATCFLRESTPGIQAVLPSFRSTPNTSETKAVSP